MFCEENIFYCHLDTDPDKEYFLYIGELKADCLNPFLKEALSRIYGKKFDFITIIPDVLSCYPHPNMIVVNPRSRQLVTQKGEKICCRLSCEKLSSKVSASDTVLDLVRDLLQKQKRLFVHVYESTPELSLGAIPGITLLGPEGEIAHRWNNKAYQLEALRKTDLPVIDFRVCSDHDELLQAAYELWSRWDHGLFVSQPYSAAGMNSFIVNRAADLKGKAIPQDSEYLVSKYIPHFSDPTVLGVVANPEDVYIAAVADQEIEDGNKFRGSTFPSALPREIQEELKRHTRTVGRALGESGYRGIFGCDFIVDETNRVHFVEVNARKQGTTMEMCCTLENLLPPGSPSLMELEFHAVNSCRFPENVTELSHSMEDICWRTYNFKTDREVIVSKSIPQLHDERELFRRVSDNNLEHGMIVMEHIGQGIKAEPGTFLGRIAAVSKRRELLADDIQKGKEMIRQSISTIKDKQK